MQRDDETDKVDDLEGDVVRVSPELDTEADAVPLAKAEAELITEEVLRGDLVTFMSEGETEGVRLWDADEEREKDVDSVREARGEADSDLDCEGEPLNVDVGEDAGERTTRVAVAGADSEKTVGVGCEDKTRRFVAVTSLSVCDSEGVTVGVEEVDMEPDTLVVEDVLKETRTVIEALLAVERNETVELLVEVFETVTELETALVLDARRVAEPDCESLGVADWDMEEVLETEVEDVVENERWREPERASENDAAGEEL
jgi:hypothetical protein